MTQPGFVERRRYFRLDDQALLGLHAITPEEAVLKQDEPITDLEVLEQQISGLLYQVQSLHPDVARLFSLLNQKVNRVISMQNRSQIALSSSLSDSDQPTSATRIPEMKLSQINLSACGMRFNGTEDFSNSRYVRVFLTLLPTHTPLTLCARVVAVERSGDDQLPLLTRLDFDPISTEDRETLIQHMLQLQTRQIKERRGG